MNDIDLAGEFATGCAPISNTTPRMQVTDESLIPTKLVRHDALMRMLPKYVAM